MSICSADTVWPVGVAGDSAAPGRDGQFDDELLVARARRGDQAAFEALYRVHAPRIHALCLRLLKNRSQAEDCTQEAFIKAWQGLEKFRGDSQFGSWLYRIASNVALGLIRKEARRSGHLRQVDDEYALDSAAAPEDQAPLRDDLEAAIGSLPDGARIVFVLHDVEGLQHEEIAEVTGTAVGTCKAQLHRARRLLREKLQ